MRALGISKVEGRREESTKELDLSVVLPALNEGGNVKPLLREFKSIFAGLGLKFEIIVVDGGSTDGTWEDALSEGAECVLQRRPGYGGALREGFMKARGNFILTLDCDLSHPPALFRELWSKRDEADVLVASRFVAGGDSQASWLRKYLSVILNQVFEKLLRVSVKDSSSGYRLYRRAVLRPADYRPENFNVLQEILVRAYADGFSVKEIPLQYQQRQAGKSHASILKFGPYYLKTLFRLWKLRQSPQAADYEHNAYNSRHLLQRFWQRKRRQLLNLFYEQDLAGADIGCGSSKFTQDHPDTLAVDISVAKLRFLRGTHRRRIAAGVEALPFKTESLEQVVFSEVLPYVSDSNSALCELNRVLKPGGILILSIPDSGRVSWKFLGFVYHRLLPNINALEERIRLSRYELFDLMAEKGFRTVKYKYVLGSELIAKFKKVESLE
jgi:dolichol-phosphate mannosyltransferase